MKKEMSFFAGQDVQYKNGFIIDGKTFPFFSFTTPTQSDHWSNDMAESLEESSKNHFIDIYNRRIAVEGLKDIIADKSAAYIDVGCSSGYMLEDIKKANPDLNIFGADYFSAGLACCNKNNPEIPLFQIDLVNCEFKDNSFDGITCLNVLEHIEEDEAALKQLCRILKPEGKIVITVPMGPKLYDIYDEVHFHVRRYGMKELVNKTKKAGFKILRYNYFASFVYPGFYLVKKLNKLKYDKLSEEEKKKIVFSQIKNTERSGFLEKISSLEYHIGKIIKYPFGIRGYIIAEKLK